MATSRFAFALLAALACTVTSGAPALAAPSGKSDPDSSDAIAKARYAEGLRLYAKGRYEEARIDFLQANALRSRPVYRLMVGLASIKVGRWLEGLHELDLLTADAGSLTAKQHALIESGQREARSHLGRLRFDLPEDSTVTIDGERVAVTREPIDVNAGRHVIVLTHRDETKTVNVEVAPEGTVDVVPEFTPKAIVPPPDTRTRPIVQPPSESNDAILAPPETTWPVYLFGAIGLGGLATAAVFGGLTANSNHAVDVMNETLVRQGQSRATCAAKPIEIPFDDLCAVLEKNERLASTHQGVFIASTIIGASATAAAFGWFFFAPKEHGEKGRTGDTRVVPWMGAGSGGARVEGRF